MAFREINRDWSVSRKFTFLAVPVSTMSEQHCPLASLHANIPQLLGWETASKCGDLGFLHTPTHSAPDPEGHGVSREARRLCGRDRHLTQWLQSHSLGQDHPRGLPSHCPGSAPSSEFLIHTARWSLEICLSHNFSGEASLPTKARISWARRCVQFPTTERGCIRHAWQNRKKVWGRRSGRGHHGRSPS